MFDLEVIQLISSLDMSVDGVVEDAWNQGLDGDGSGTVYTLGL